MNKWSMLGVAVFVCGFSVSALANDCQGQFLDGQAPKVLQQSLLNRTQQLCFSGFALLHSGVAKTSLYSAEYLTKDRVFAAAKLPRDDSFHAEPRLAVGDRAELSDYKRSGYDRGHLAPNKDMSTREMQAESFSLANMMPQNPNNNQNLHKGLENATRNLAVQYGSVYVATGPAFKSSKLQKIGNVLVPTNVWKAVYIPKLKMGAAYWEQNAPGMNYEVISLQELSTRIGIDVFPSLPTSVKQRAANLPGPDLSN